MRQRRDVAHELLLVVERRSEAWARASLGGTSGKPPTCFERSAAVWQAQPETAGRVRQRISHALATAIVRNVSRTGRYCDGHGLYLKVRLSGSGSWVQRLATRGMPVAGIVHSAPAVSISSHVHGTGCPT